MSSRDHQAWRLDVARETQRRVLQEAHDLKAETAEIVKRAEESRARLESYMEVARERRIILRNSRQRREQADSSCGGQVGSIEHDTGGAAEGSQ